MIPLNSLVFLIDDDASVRKGVSRLLRSAGYNSEAFGSASDFLTREQHSGPACVIVDVQRGGPSTGLPTKVSQGDINQARWGVHGDHSIIALTASNHQDVFAMTVEAFNFSETYRTPVILLFDEVVGHMRERLVIPEPGEIPLVERLKTSVKEGVDYHPYLPREDGRLPMSDFGGVHRYNVTGLVHDMWGFPSTEPRTVHALLRHLVDKLENRSNELARYKEFYLEDAEIVVVAYGELLTHDVLELSPQGAINLHFSLLPRWRGAAPVARALCSSRFNGS